MHFEKIYILQVCNCRLMVWKKNGTWPTTMFVVRRLFPTIWYNVACSLYARHCLTLLRWLRDDEGLSAYSATSVRFPVTFLNPAICESKFLKRKLCNKTILLHILTVYPTCIWDALWRIWWGCRWQMLWRSQQEQSSYTASTCRRTWRRGRRDESRDRCWQDKENWEKEMRHVYLKKALVFSSTGLI